MFVEFLRTFPAMPPWPHAAGHVRPLLVEYITYGRVPLVTWIV